MSVFQEVSINFMFPWFWYHFRRTFRLSLEKCVRVHALLCPPEYLWNRLTIQEDLANGRPNLDSHPSFYFVFWVLGSDPLPEASPSLRSWAGLVEEKSRNVDVEDELLPELADNPGTRSEKLSVLHITVFFSLVNRGFWPLTHWQEYPWSSQSFPSDKTAGVCSSNCIVTQRSRSWTCMCASSFVCISPLARTIAVLFLDLRKVSSSSELQSFLHSVCIDALELTTKFRSSGDFEVGASIAVGSTEEYNDALSAFLCFCIFSTSPMPLRGCISLGARFSLVTSARTRARQDYDHEVHTFQ